MLNAHAEAIGARLAKQRTTKEPSIVEIKIKMYEDAIALKNTSIPEVTSDERFQKSFRKLLEMYKSGELDGTKITHVCIGEVIDLASPDNRPPYTIIDGLGIRA